MERFVDKWAVDHESCIVEARAQLRCYDVKVGSVIDGDGSLVEHKQRVSGPSPGRCGIGEIKLIAV